MELYIFLAAVIIALIFLYGIREIRSSLGKISTDVRDLKSALHSASKSQD
jgi:outer membrane murein-binding lipoprotein Lpp